MSLMAADAVGKVSSYSVFDTLLMLATPEVTVTVGSSTNGSKQGSIVIVLLAPTGTYPSRVETDFIPFSTVKETVAVSPSWSVTTTTA